MPERRVSTLADAQRQVRVQGFIGGLLIVLVLLFLPLFLVKHLYLNLPHDRFVSEQGKDLRQFIDALVDVWPELTLLWRTIPPWQSIHPLPTTPLWDYVSVVWGTIVVSFVGGLLRWNAHTRGTEIREYYRQIQHEAWKPQAHATGGAAPDDHRSTVIEQTISHADAAPPKVWSQTLWGILIVSLSVALVSGLILFSAEYAFFQAYRPPGRH